MQSKWLVSLDKMATAERVFMAALNLDPRQFYRRGMTFNDKGFTALSAVKPDEVRCWTVDPRAARGDPG
jgi:hypothetical protein